MINISQPLVSCIMPTANRRKYIPLAIQNYLQQDYAHTELVIIDDGQETILDLIPDHLRINYIHMTTVSSLGAKRNIANQYSKGEIIVHWDDDDWYAPDWISRQVQYLLNSKADMCGVEYIHFYSVVTDTLWKGTAFNRNKGYRQQWVCGATLAYWRTFWEQHPFEDKNTGEDDAFIMTAGANVFAHDYIDGFIARLHPDNTTVKYFEHPNQKRKSRT